MVKREWPRVSEFRDHAVGGITLPRFLGQDATEQAIIRNAERTGLSNLTAPRRISLFSGVTRAFSRGVQVLPKRVEGDDQVVAPTLSSQYQQNQKQRPQPLVVVAQRFRCWIMKQIKRFTWTNVLAAASFLDSVYILLSAPLRLGFFFDPWQDTSFQDSWQAGLVVFTTVDVAGSVLRIWNSREDLARGRRRLLNLKTSQSEPVQQPLEQEQLRHDVEAILNDSERSDKLAPSRSDGLFTSTSLLLYCTPWEILLLIFLKGQHVNILHVFGVVRLLSAYYRVGGQLSAATGGMPQKWSSGTVANMMVLFLYGSYFCHFAASGYMLLAHWECGLDFSKCEVTPASLGCWVLRDRLESGSRLRQYVRTLYWACKTVVTLGQGDVIPVTLAETAYRIVIQFCAGLWVTAILTAYTFYFTHKDANLTSNISTRLDQALRFLEARKVPAQLVISVDTYFQYMQRTRNGVEEELILAALPPHYRTQCSHYVRYKALGQLAIFRRRKGAFLRTVMGALVRDVYAPGQTLLHPGEMDEMFIVASGEVRLINSRSMCVGRIIAGSAYAEYALFERHIARNRLEATTFCEVWYLPSKSFKAALAKHFSKLVFAALLLQQFGIKTKKAGDDSSTIPGNEPDERVDSVTSMRNQARNSRIFGHGSLLLQAVEARKVRAAAAATISATASATSELILPYSSTQQSFFTIAAWRMPSSKLRQKWALIECVIMLYLLAEVPYHLAFQRGFGLLNGISGAESDGTTPRSVQIASFLVALTVEMFFYADLWLRARYFVRPFPAPENNDEFLSDTARVGDTQDSTGCVNASCPELATRSSQIFQLYMQRENLMLEICALVPAALIWDILPKELFSRRAAHVLRCLRLLRLLRVRKLRDKMHAILAGWGFGPAPRLLADVVVFCAAGAHTAACIFFAVADRTSFEGGLPSKGVLPRSLSLQGCLEDASRFDNCTWYMYDRSSFDMETPYLRSMLWSIVVLSTVGFGDIMAFSTRECFVDALWIFFGANICYFTSCALSSALAQLNVLSTIRSERAEGINVLLMSPCMTSVSDSTKRFVRSYYEAKWKLNGSAVGDLEMLEHLPRSLRRAVSTQLYASDLRCCALFVQGSGLNGSSSNGDAALFMQQLALVITCEHFLRNVTVIREGHLATDFFVILSGELECLLPPVPRKPIDTPTKTIVTTKMTRKSIHIAAAAVLSRTRDSALARKFSGSTTTLNRSPTKRAEEVVSALRPRVPAQARLGSVGEEEPLQPSNTRLTLVETPIALRQRPARSGSFKLPVGALNDSAATTVPIPFSILKQHDYFGDESLSDISKTYEVSVRVVSSARVAVIRRRDFLALASRFPHYVARLRTRKRELRDRTLNLVAAHRANFRGESNKKLVRVLGTCASLYVDSSKSKLEKRGTRVLDPTSTFARWWHRGIGFILVYNFYVIIFRLAFLPYPDPSILMWFTWIDYALDMLLYADLILKFGHLGFLEFGELVLDPEAIKLHYRTSGHVWHDCLGMLPVYYHGDAFGMTAARLPRLLRCLQLGELLQEVHTEIQERFLRGNAVLLSAFDLVKFFLIFVSTAHYISSLYYLLGWVQIKTGLARTSWVSADLVLKQNPDDPIVHYMRSMYWCLSSFTVDCFGDILARNILETCYELFTCVLGWIFIGQVIGRINALMVTLDKARKLRNDRVEDFQQYAKQRALPDRLRLRAMKGLAIKAECQLELELPSTLRDLPGSLRALVAGEMYNAILKPLPEFAALSSPQLEVMARALNLEIYLPGDIICETNRVGTRLYLLKHGCAERVAPHTGVVYGALTDGALFGEFAFFLPGARRLFSVRAVRSCQVLQLQRRVWDRLWPPSVRAQVEQSVLPVITRKYRDAARGFLNIAKNFYIKNDTPVPALGLKRQFPVMSRAFPMKNELEVTKQTVVPPETSKLASGIVHSALVGIGSPSDSFLRRPSASDISSTSEGVDIEELYQSQNETEFDVSANLDALESYCDTTFDSAKEVSVTPVESLSPAALAPQNDSLIDRSPSVWCEPCSIATAEPVGPLARLSTSVEFRWKRYEKRLRAIQLFHVTWGHVLEDLQNVGEAGATGRIMRRRNSICVLPSYTEAQANQLAQVAAQLQMLGRRRNSIQTDPADLRAKFQLSTSEVRTLEQRMVSASAGTVHPSSPTMLAEIASSQTRSTQPDLHSWRQRWRRESSLSSKKVAPASSANGQPLLQNAPYSIWVMQGAQNTRFVHNARFRDMWSAIMLTVTIYYLLSTPLQIGFLDGVLNDADNEPVVMIWFAMEYFIADSACMVDFMLHRRYFVYQTATGETVTDPQRIARNYWSHGWYFVDVLSMLPLELVMFAFVVGLRLAGHAPPAATTSDWPLFSSPSGGLVNWHTFAFLRINRFLRVVHLHPLSDQLQRFLLYDRRLSGLTPGVCYLFRLALDFSMGTHWLACLFYGVSYLAYEDGEQSWLTTPDMLAFGDGVRNLADIRQVPILQSYLRTYHFSIGAITTVCYGDILPMNAQETLATMAVIFISVAIFSMLSGSFYKYFDMELGRRAEYEEKVAQVGHFLRFHRFPTDTWRQMQVYFALSWCESRGRHERELLRGLPPSVRQDLAQHVHANLLENVTLFTRCDPKFAQAIIAALQHEFFVRNDVIIQRGDMERSLYIVENGVVLISAVRKRKAQTIEAVDPEAEEYTTTEDGMSVSVNEWVAVKTRTPVQRKSKRVDPSQVSPTKRQRSVVSLMSPTGTMTDINDHTEREMKIYKGPFDYFGERSLLFGTPRNATCIALCVTSLFVLTSARFEAILDEFPHERSNSVSAWVMTRTPARLKQDGAPAALP